MRKILLIAGLLAGLVMIVFCLHPDWHLSEAGPPLPISRQEQDHRDHDKQREAPPGSFPPDPESHQIRRGSKQVAGETPVLLEPSPRVNWDHSLYPFAPGGPSKESSNGIQLRQPRRNALPIFGQDSRDPLPPGDWDWEVIRHHCPGSGKPDSPFMRDLGLDGHPAIPGGGVPGW